MGAPMPEPAAAEPAPSPGHLDAIEGLRAAAALVVYVNHAYAQAWNPMRDEYPTGVLGALSYSLVAGHLAVTVFIVISGLCLGLPVAARGHRLREGVRGFFARRALRILPPYYASVALCLLLIGTVLGEETGSLWDVPIHVDGVAVVSHLLLLQDLFGTGRINYVLWSIAVEWQLYLLFPLLLAAVRRVGLGRAVGAALVLGYAARWAGDGTRLDRANPHYLGMFALGLLAASVLRSGAPWAARFRTFRGWSVVAFAAALAVAALAVQLGFAEATRQFWLLDLPTGVCAFALLVGACARPASGPGWVLGSRPLTALGVVSYSFYLVHAPALQALWLFVCRPLGLGNGATFAFLMTAGLAAVCLIAALFHRAVERPFLRRLRGAGGAAQAPTPAAGAPALTRPN